MYSTCISCNAPLGKNEVLEQFPVGRRLAFDPHTGRLWVLCRFCRSWNLAPLEERWEAVEAAERLFEHASIGSSIENVAVGRLRDGTDLVRLGRAHRPELAAWRYGDRLLGRWKRRRRQFWLTLGGAAAMGTVPILGHVALWPVLVGGGGIKLLRERRPFMRTADGQPIRASDASKALLLPLSAEQWSVVIPRPGKEDISLEGDDALRALRGFLPRINREGGRREQVREATREVERLGSPDRIFHEAAQDLGRMRNMSRQDRWPWNRVGGRISAGHPVVQLALEMAANEEVERRALKGEMSLLEKEWREAEDLAAISDDLLLPHSVRERIRKWKDGEAQ